MDSSLAAVVVAFIVGACIGSFLNVCIGRWPAGESVVRPPSRCPRCQRPIRAWENVPILGWLFLGGRCRGCRDRISIQYPVVELAVALGWAACFASFAPFTALRVAVFGTVLLGIAVTDLETMTIPDGFTVFGLFWVLATALPGALLGVETPLFVGLYDALLGACAGAGIIAIIMWLGELALGREAMGFGDATMMAVVGAALGFHGALLTVFLGALLGAVASLLLVAPPAWLRWRRAAAAAAAAGEPHEPFALPHIPFGVFLAPAAMLTLLWGDRLITWYRVTHLGR